MPLSSSDLGSLVGPRPEVHRISKRISVCDDLCAPDGIDALLNLTGKTISTDLPHCRVNVSNGAPTAVGRALSFLSECERLGLHVLICGSDAQSVAESWRSREIVR